ncbi:MAG: type II toxin-antitoxin system RelE/ParE family toxin [archaeon]
MFSVIIGKKFESSLSKIKEKIIRKQIWKKIDELEFRCPIGKKLKDDSSWSIHINKYRVIYEFKGKKIKILKILPRKKDYRDL